MSIAAESIAVSTTQMRSTAQVQGGPDQDLLTQRDALKIPSPMTSSPDSLVLVVGYRRLCRPPTNARHNQPSGGRVTSHRPFSPPVTLGPYDLVAMRNLTGSASVTRNDRLQETPVASLAHSPKAMGPAECTRHAKGQAEASAAETGHHPTDAKWSSGAPLRAMWGRRSVAFHRGIGFLHGPAKHSADHD